MTRRALTDAPTMSRPDPSSEPQDAVTSASRRQLTWRLNEVAARLGVSRRAVERLRSAGRFPKPDLVIGRMPLWRPQNIDRWIEGGGRP
jgi:predicted DNA-binding transcriptional regulator AlpA